MVTMWVERKPIQDLNDILSYMFQAHSRIENSTVSTQKYFLNLQQSIFVSKSNSSNYITWTFNVKIPIMYITYPMKAPPEIVILKIKSLLSMYRKDKYQR